MYYFNLQQIKEYKFNNIKKKIIKKKEKLYPNDNDYNIFKISVTDGLVFILALDGRITIYDQELTKRKVEFDMITYLRLEE